MNTVKEAHKEVCNMYLQTAANIVAHCDGDSQKKTLERLLEMAKTSCTLEMKVRESHAIMERLTSEKNDFNENLEVPDHQETLKQFKNQIASIDADGSKHKNFSDIKEQVKALLDDKASKDPGNGDDEELVVTQKEITVIDPITKKRITDPVRNTACGHVYDRESIQHLLKASKRTKCPVVGCRNKNFVNSANLQTDIITKNYLDKNPHQDH